MDGKAFVLLIGIRINKQIFLNEIEMNHLHVVMVFTQSNFIFSSVLYKADKVKISVKTQIKDTRLVCRSRISGRIYKCSQHKHLYAICFVFTR